jgi:hypothetical protein
MGLDMYLTGDKYTPSFGDNKREVVDGYEVESHRLKLGYWRKHWALHNYIEENYGSTDDHRFHLESDDLRDIATAVADGKLVDPVDDYMPSYAEVYAYHRKPEQVRETVNALRKAADWLDGGEWRSVEYVGSW